MTATRTRPEVRSQVEPRIVERRRTVLEAHRRRRRRRWIALGVVVALVAAVLGALWSPLADVDRITVTGATSLDEAQVRELTGLATGDQMVVIDLAAARDRLRAHPMVAAASVHRVWPDTVRVEVVEEAPVVRVRAGGRDLVVARTGAVLPEASVASLDGVESLPVLELDEGVDAVTSGDGSDQALAPALEPVLALYAHLPTALRGALAQGTLAADGSLTFALPDGATVRFGPLEDVPAKLVAMQAFLEQVALECLDVLDVSTERVTASRAAGCVPPAPTEVDDTNQGAGQGATSTTVAQGDGA